MLIGASVYGPASRTGSAQEPADGGVEPLGRLHRTGMTDAVQDDQLRAGDGRVHGLGDGKRCAGVLIADQHQRRHGYQAEHRARSASAEARAIARNPAGWNSRTVAANATTRSRAADVENRLGSSTSTKSSGG